MSFTASEGSRPMAQVTSRFSELSRAATIVSLVVSAGFVLVGMITGLPWVIGIFGFLFLAALAVVPWGATPNTSGRARR
jgi:hypothetical protein